MHTDMYPRSHKTKGRGWAVDLFFLSCICGIVSKGAALSVIVQNGTFEVGSLDAQIEVKITPKPETVLKVNWYHCSSQHNCSKFYSVDNTEDKTEKLGDLGERTSHFLMNNDQEYIIFLVITKPKGIDSGEYCCQIQVAHEERPLQGNLSLTKLEALSDTSAGNITAEVGASVMSLSLRISPANTTLYWLKCFHSATPEPSAHFYTYNKNLNTVTAAGDLGTRTSHKADIRRQEMWFSLVIQNPNTGDAGPYCCQVDAVGVMEPRLVIMWVKIKATNSSSFNENLPGQNKITDERPPSSFILGLFGALSSILIAIFAVVGYRIGLSTRRDVSCDGCRDPLTARQKIT